MKIKKSLIVLSVLIVSLFLAGCLDYKSYQVPQEEKGEEDLLNEIAEIEKELNIEEKESSSEEITGAVIEEIDEEIKNESLQPETLPEIKPEAEEKIPEEKTPSEEIDLSQLQKIEVNENDLVSLALKVDDPDKDKVTYSFSLPLNEQGKWKTNYGDAGEYVVTITASDGTHNTKKDILLIIKRVNVPPLIKEIKDQAIKEGETLTLEPQVIDPNGDAVTVTVSPPLSTNTWVTDHTSAGEYQIIITASDGEMESKENFLLTVQDVNVLPEVVGLADLKVKEGEKVEIKPTITDLDNDKITLTISEPVGNDGLWQTAYTDHGIYPLTVTVADGKDTVTKTLTLTVEDVNMPPEIIEVTLG